MAQPKVLKLREYFVYFPISELHGWVKRPAVQPQTIYSEIPKERSIPMATETKKTAWIDTGNRIISFRSLENAMVYCDEEAAFWRRLLTLMHRGYKVT